MITTSKEECLQAILPAFIDSASEVFNTMVFTPISPGNPAEKSKGFPKGSISGTISLTGDELCGNLSLIFSMPLAFSLFRSMMGMEPNSPVNEQEITDVVGELANMVAGGAKSRLQEQNIHFNIGLPTVVVGENHYLEPPKNVKTVVVPLSTSEETFFLELSL